jgi:hypothetical protein
MSTPYRFKGQKLTAFHPSLTRRSRTAPGHNHNRYAPILQIKKSEATPKLVSADKANNTFKAGTIIDRAFLALNIMLLIMLLKNTPSQRNEK